LAASFISEVACLPERAPPERRGGRRYARPDLLCSLVGAARGVLLLAPISAAVAMKHRSTKSMSFTPVAAGRAPAGRGCEGNEIRSVWQPKKNPPPGDRGVHSGGEVDGMRLVELESNSRCHATDPIEASLS
jgi:hypothetical protein